MRGPRLLCSSQHHLAPTREHLARAAASSTVLQLKQLDAAAWFDRSTKVRACRRRPSLPMLSDALSEVRAPPLGADSRA
jgi:hypothetical protein